jgi:uncharacterized protein
MNATTNVSMSVARRPGRQEQIEAILAAIVNIRGVTAAAIVDGDGFVNHARRDFDLNTDALGAAVQVTLGTAARAAEHVSQGSSELVLLENKDGLVLLAPLAKRFSLAVIAERDVMLGAMRYEVKQSIPALAALF